MREILFRAKRINTYKWVEGLPFLMSMGDFGVLCIAKKSKPLCTNDYSEIKEEYFMRHKKIIAMITATIMTIGMTTTAFAVTPQYNSWVSKIPTITWDSLSDESKEIINDAVKDIVGNIDFDVTLSSPKISEATYHHGRYFYDRTRLQVRWGKVTDADHYEVRVTKKDGTSKVYETTNTSLFVYEGSDDFIAGCVRSSKVEVRACSDSGNSAWSVSKTITCNSFH